MPATAAGVERDRSYAQSASNLPQLDALQSGCVPPSRATRRRERGVFQSHEDANADNDEQVRRTIADGQHDDDLRHTFGLAPAGDNPQATMIFTRSESRPIRGVQTSAGATVGLGGDAIGIAQPANQREPQELANHENVSSALAIMGPCCRQRAAAGSVGLARVRSRSHTRGAGSMEDALGSYRSPLARRPHRLR